MNTSPQLSVVCPFYNEEAIIEAAITRMIKNLQTQVSVDWELILVNDGSADSSLELVISKLAALNDKRVKVVSYPINQGRGRALKSGIDAAQGDIIITTEVDCSWGDDIVERLRSELENHPETDFVIASPHLPGGGLVNVPLQRILMTKGGNLLIRTFFSSSVTMNTGMTRAYRRHVILPLIVHDNGKEFHLEVLLKLLTLGFKVREIPAVITWDEKKLFRNENATRKSSTNLKKTIFSHLRFVAMVNPVLSFAILAFVSLITGMACIGVAVWMLLIHKVAIYFAMVGLIMLLFSLLFGGFSLIFLKFQESFREQWMNYYPKPHPPSRVNARILYPELKA